MKSRLPNRALLSLRPWHLATACALAPAPAVARAAEPPGSPPVVLDPNDSTTGKPSVSPAASASSGVSVTADVEAHAKSADALWKSIQQTADLGETNQPLRALGEEPKDAKSIALRDYKNARLRLATAEFFRRYPQDSRRYAAKVLIIRQGHLSDEERARIWQEIAFAPDAPLELRSRARYVVLLHNEGAFSGHPDDNPGLTPELEKQIAAFEQDFPDDKDGAQCVSMRLGLLRNTPDKTISVLTPLTKSPNHFTAAAATKALDLRTKPLELKFTGLDGQEVDFAKLRGKVARLNFWATPGMQGMQKLPEILEVRQKYKDQGLVILGVAMDPAENKGEVEQTVRSQHLDWPNGFDGAVPRHFGLQRYPSVFLVNKAGLLHEVSPEANPAEEVGKLLAAQD